MDCGLWKPSAETNQTGFGAKLKICGCLINKIHSKFSHDWGKAAYV